jgi:hypothetical protein
MSAALIINNAKNQQYKTAYVDVSGFTQATVNTFFSLRTHTALHITTFRLIATKILLGNALGYFDGYKTTSDGKSNGPKIRVLRDTIK